MPKKYYRIVSRQDAVRRARIFAGLTSEVMAARIDLSRPMLSSIENGAGTTVKTASKIAACLNKTVEDLFEVLDTR
jgi:DNA-binding XRE family transcriptional regulator